MKTNKEIKPFKMRVNGRQSKKVQKIVLLNGYELADMWDNHDILVLSGDTLYSYHGKHLNLSDEQEPELTYSEFMKLYEGEEEVFTREDMKAFVWECLLNECTTRSDVEQQLTKFLSERTNG